MKTPLGFEQFKEKLEINLKEKLRCFKEKQINTYFRLLNAVDTELKKQDKINQGIKMKTLFKSALKIELVDINPERLGSFQHLQYHLNKYLENVMEGIILAVLDTLHLNYQAYLKESEQYQLTQDIEDFVSISVTNQIKYRDEKFIKIQLQCLMEERGCLNFQLGDIRDYFYNLVGDFVTQVEQLECLGVKIVGKVRRSGLIKIKIKEIIEERRGEVDRVFDQNFEILENFMKLIKEFKFL